MRHEGSEERYRDQNKRQVKPNVEFYLACRGLEGAKKKSVEIVLLFSIAFFLLQCIWIITDSVKLTLLDTRIEQYGEWEYCLADRSAESALKDISKSGFVYLLGEIRNMEGNERVPIGYFDPGGQELARISLVEGRLPETSREIAIEMEAMNLLGIPYEIGQIIEGEVLYPGKNPDGSVFYDLTQTEFTICGVIKSYSSGWATADKITMPSVFVVPGAENTLTEGRISQRSELFCLKNQAGQEEVFKNVKDYYQKEALRINPGSRQPVSVTLISNTKTYLENPFEALDGILKLLLTAGILISGCVILISSSKNIRMQDATWKQLKLLGAQARQIWTVIFWQCLFFILGGLIAGTMIGICLSIVLLQGIGWFSGEPVIIFINPAGIAGNCVSGILLSVSGTILPALCLNCEFRKLGMRRRSCKRTAGYVKKTGRKRRSLSFIKMSMKTLAETPLRTLLLIILMSGYLASMIQIIFRIETSISGYRYSADREADYRISMVNISVEQIERLNHAPGIKEIQAVQYSGDFHINPGEHAIDEYFRAVKEKQNKWWPDKDSSDHEVAVNVLGIEESEKWNRFLTEEYRLSGDEIDRFYRGEFICLFLPELYVADNPEFTMAGLYEGYFPDQVKLLNTDAVKAGDTVTLVCADGAEGETLSDEKAVKVGAVAHVYQFENSRYNEIASGAYGVIMSGRLLNSFQNFSGKDCYQIVNIMADPTATYETTDKTVSVFGSKAPKGGFYNIRMQRNEQYQQMLTDVSVLLFLAVLLTVIISLLIYHMSLLETERVKGRIALLQCLGMKRRQIFLMYQYKGILTGIGCMVMGILLYLLSVIYQVNREGDTVYSAEILIWRKIDGTNWTSSAVIIVLFLIVNLFLAYGPVRKALKRSPTENMEER